MHHHSSDDLAFDDWDGQNDIANVGDFWQPGDDEDNAVDDWREGETFEQRNARVLSGLDERSRALRGLDFDKPKDLITPADLDPARADRIASLRHRHYDKETGETISERVGVAHQFPEVIPGPIVRGADKGARRGEMLRDQATKPTKAPVYLIGPDGSREPLALGSDRDAVALFMAEITDVDLLELMAATPAGRLTAAERERRDKLATVVAKAREHGATFETIAAIIGRPLSSVHALADRGRALLGTAA